MQILSLRRKKREYLKCRCSWPIGMHPRFSLRERADPSAILSYDLPYFTVQYCAGLKARDRADPGANLSYYFTGLKARYRYTILHSLSIRIFHHDIPALLFLYQQL